MSPKEIQSSLQLPYLRDRWLELLRALLPQTEVFLKPRSLDAGAKEIKSAIHIANIELADGKTVAVLEIEVSGRVDIERNRVGLRNRASQFIDQDKAHAVIGLFVDEDSDDADYRFSFVARSSELSDDGQLSRKETEKRRYTYELGRGKRCRTAAERLHLLSKSGKTANLASFVDAFKVEPLFDEFFRDYRRVFENVKDAIRPSFSPAPEDKDKEPLQMFTQRLFNRLMFLAFIERKGWLKMGRRTDYLSALWESRASGPQANFYLDHLVPLFFEGLNQPDRQPDHTAPRFGSVPYLNGGLFEKADLGYDDNTSIRIPDEALASILDASDSDDSKHGLFTRYNFTVSESTPLDIEVAVDPEMLGKVFEELVTERNESGSFYTPKPIVSFMCREALVGYLASRCAKEDRRAIEAFVHEHTADQLRDPEAILSALKSVTVCDLACGSGAYLLGMLHELMDLRMCLFASNQKLDSGTAHSRKLEIIEKNLYGVDKDGFAVGIARLRLWLSLAVEYDGSTPPPALPNLDFKIEQGDSLAAPAPAEVETDLFHAEVIALRDLKATYLKSHGETKARLRAEIDQRKAGLKQSFVSHKDAGPSDAFQWSVEFAEIFIPTPLSPKGGFDIIVANPPYVRMELIKPQKPVLKKRFKDVHSDRADLFVYFYARAHELLRDGGTSAFISSNKWLRTGYGEPLRERLLDSQAFGLVMDFGELRVFKTAATDAAIFIWEKRSRSGASTRWVTVKNLQECYAEGVKPHFDRLAVAVPAEQFGKGKPRLATSATADLRERMEKSGPQMGEVCNGKIFFGLKTSLNEAFIVDESVRKRLIAESPEALEIIKPIAFGDDVRRYELHFRNQYVLLTKIGVPISRYPSVFEHLSQYEAKARKRTDQGNHWWELRTCDYYEAFAQPKILIPAFALEPRFVLDTSETYLVAPAYFISSGDYYLLGVLNSKSAFRLLLEICSVFGDKEAKGRAILRPIYFEKLPIPAASEADRSVVATLAERTQVLCGQRRAQVERFLSSLGVDPAQSTSRNPLEQPWSLQPAEFAKRVKPLQRVARENPQLLYEAARDETAALTEQIAKLEAEIDARVAALYGLDDEDQRWAAQAAPSAQPPDKEKLFFKILGGLKEHSAYFTHKSIQSAVNDAELGLKDEVLNVYLHQAVKQGLIHDAGRGWYSRLAEPVKLDLHTCSKLVREVEKAFPLLDFTVWSTAQLNPWMHHLLAKPVHFLHAPREALETIGDALRDKGWEVALNPGKREAAKVIRPDEKMVVLRPLHSKQPPPGGRQMAVEQVLVEMLDETDALALMDTSEAEAAFLQMVLSGLIQIPVVQRFADFKRVNLPDLEAIN
jgi:hypothetical protein